MAVRARVADHSGLWSMEWVLRQLGHTEKPWLELKKEEEEEH